MKFADANNRNRKSGGSPTIVSRLAAGESSEIRAPGVLAESVGPRPRCWCRGRPGSLLNGAIATGFPCCSNFSVDLFHGELI
jgi:hypothetical protein